ncbi:MAG: hypothetical protein RIM99_16215 [Cyclobacteriaceae bacterium]
MKQLISLIILLFSLNLAAQPDLTKLDGKISSNERQRFELQGANGNSSISTSIDDDFLRINVSSDSLYVASLCLCTSDNEIIVLHASAALGRVNYERTTGQIWKSDDKFDWRIREPEMTPEIIQKRLEHLNNYGWVANTLGMGTGQDAEFIIRKDLFESNTIYLAAGLMSRADPENIIPLPAKTAGDCADFALVAGPPKPEYSFDPKKWFKIDLKD